MSCSVSSADYDSTEDTGKQITNKQELVTRRAEVFMDDASQAVLTAYVMTALDAYTTALQLP